MRPISRWRHMMSSTVWVQERTGSYSDGVPDYGDPVAYRAHLSRDRTLLRTPQGEELGAGLAIYLETTRPIPQTARVTLSTGDVGSTEEDALHPVLASVGVRSDGAGPHHVVLFCERRFVR